MSEWLFQATKSNIEQKYYLYLPENAEAASIMLSVHGISMNAQSHAEHFLPFAKQHGCILIAPLFDKAKVPEYNCLGPDGKGRRSDELLDSIIDDVRIQTGNKAEKFLLFGYSAGAQFAHRYALCHPEKLSKLAFCSPGYYTWLDSKTKFPFGLESMPHHADLDAFLSVPLFLSVGNLDVLRTSSLLQTPQVDQQQGTTRVERAQNWYKTYEKLLVDRNLDTPHRFATLIGVGHGFEGAMEKAHLGEYVSDFFFGE